MLSTISPIVSMLCLMVAMVFPMASPTTSYASYGISHGLHGDPSEFLVLYMLSIMACTVFPIASSHMSYNLLWSLCSLLWL